MSILIDKETKLIIQGITGREGSFHGQRMVEYGTKVVAGVTPGKGGQEVFGIPVYDTVRQAYEKLVLMPQLYLSLQSLQQEQPMRL